MIPSVFRNILYSLMGPGNRKPGRQFWEGKKWHEYNASKHSESFEKLHPLADAMLKLATCGSRPAFARAAHYQFLWLQSRLSSGKFWKPGSATSSRRCRTLPRSGMLTRAFSYFCCPNSSPPCRIRVRHPALDDFCWASFGGCSVVQLLAAHIRYMEVFRINQAFKGRFNQAEPCPDLVQLDLCAIPVPR